MKRNTFFIIVGIVFIISAAGGVWMALKQAPAIKPSGNYQLKNYQFKQDAQGNNIIANQPVVKISATPSPIPQNIVKKLNFDVAIESTKFNPAELTIKTGNSVMWRNKDSVEHSVTKSGDQGPDSPPLSKGQGFLFIFTKPGTYQYHDSLNPQIKGTITVE